MISHLHKYRRHTIISKGDVSNIIEIDDKARRSSMYDIERIEKVDSSYTTLSGERRFNLSIPKSIPTMSTRSRLSHLSANEPELDEKSIKELLEKLLKGDQE